MTSNPLEKEWWLEYTWWPMDDMDHAGFSRVIAEAERRGELKAVAEMEKIIQDCREKGQYQYVPSRLKSYKLSLEKK